MTQQPFPPITREYPLTLASASPRRRRLLTQIGLPFFPVPSHVNEEDGGGDPAAASLMLAERKALEGFRLAGEFWTLGADTMVVIGGRVLGKPADAADARRMLRLLAGRTHQVVTGFCLLNPAGTPVHSEAVSTEVRFRCLEGREIEAYIHTREPFGKAGGYAIQGVGAFLVEGISGSYTNVVGLPVCALIKAVVRAGALPLFPIPPG